MNNDRFRSMQEQLTPSPAAQAALRKKLSSLPEQHRTPRRWWPATACAAVLLVAVPLLLHAHSRTVPGSESHLHSYVMEEETSPSVREESADVQTPDAAVPEDAPEGSAASQPADSGEVAVQPAAEIYQALMAWFTETGGTSENGDPAYPDWYGGAWISDDPDVLMVCLAEKEDTPELQEEIRSAVQARLPAGSQWGPDSIRFTQGTYSLPFLRELQDKVEAEPDVMAVLSACGVSEPENRLMLSLTEPNEEALTALARLDPDNTAISVTISPVQSVLPEEGDEPAVTSHAVATPQPDTDTSNFTEPGIPRELPAAKTPVEEGSAVTFTGRVLEVQDDQVLVEALSRVGPLSKGDQGWCTWEDTSFLAPDDVVEVTFTGMVLETWPCQIPNVQSIVVLE